MKHEWKTFIEQMNDGGSVVAGVVVNPDGSVRWLVTEGINVAKFRNKELKGSFSGELAHERARKAAEDAFYSYLDHKSMRKGAI